MSETTNPIVQHGLNSQQNALNPEDGKVFTGSAVPFEVASKIAYSLEDGKAFPYCKGRSGVVIVHTDRDGTQYEQFRPHNPPLDSEGNPVKYVFHKGHSPQLTEVRWLPRNESVLIVEGTRQMYAAGAHAPDEYNVLGMTGCWGWSKNGRPPKLDYLKGMTVTVVFDADVSNNPDVYKAARKFREHLKSAGTKEVTFAHLEDHGDGNDGLDDILSRVDELERRDLLKRIIADARSLGAEPSPRNGFNVTSVPVAVRDLKSRIGTGELSDAFYVGSELSWMSSDGSVYSLGPNQLSALMTDRYTVYKVVTDKDTKELVNAETVFGFEGAKLITEYPGRLANVRDLNGFIVVPTPRADGTLINTPGYDEESGMYYTPSVEVPDVPSNPTKAQVRAAREYLQDEILEGFPFQHKDNDRANMIGLMISPLLRQIVAPPYKMGIITATQRGTGKGYLTNMLITLYGGELETQFVTDQVELRKRVTALLTSTTGTVIAFDNVVGTVKSPVLDALLTSHKISDRVMGESRTVEAINDRMWVLNGNNVEIGGDLARRVLWVGMHYPGPNPENRTTDQFKISDFPHHVKENRGKILHALLTLIAAWVAAGKPIDQRSTDSFGHWAGIVRGILSVAEIPGEFDAPRVEGDTSDSDSDETGGFLRILREQFGDEPFTVKDIKDALVNDVQTVNDTFREAGKSLDQTELPEELMNEFKFDHTPGKSAFAQKLGKWFKNKNGAWADGMTVESIDNGTKSKKSKQYRVRIQGE